jgi:apolipoprotein N-acyltransferase
MRHGIAGEDPGLFHLADGRLVGVLICWENLFSDLSRRLERGGASVFVQLTDDTDFPANAAPKQHAIASVMRAVEYARPVIVASAGGPSFAVDAYGRKSPELEGKDATTTVSVNTGDGTTVYDRVGLMWLWVVSIVAAAWGGRRSATTEDA